MSLPPDQQQLYQEFATRLNQQPDEAAVLRFMGLVLQSLLRRKGDAEFRSAVQDAFIGGIAGRSWPEQMRLAHDVLTVIIEIRPEIARAWQALKAGGEEKEVPHRRATDNEPAVWPKGQEEGDPPPERTPVAATTAAFVAAMVTRRLETFRVPKPGFPSPAYCHHQPFFLFSPEFARVAATFITDVLMEACAEPMEIRVYRQLAPKLSSSSEDVQALLNRSWDQIVKILAERLSKLATHYRSAEDKLARAQEAGGDSGGWKIVEVPVSRPRIFRVLGVAFSLGTTTATRRVKVRTGTDNEINPAEMEALQFIARFRDMAARTGLEIPPACDFHFLRTVLEFDVRRFQQVVKEFLALAGHKETSRRFLFERLEWLDKTLPNTLADTAVLMLFAQLPERGFGFRELYDVCVGTAREASAVANMRPFVQPEVARRPRELAFQIREALKRRASEDEVDGAAQMLIDVWRTVAKVRFEHELEAAVSVLAAFPLAFADDPNESVYSAIGDLLIRTLNSQVSDWGQCLLTIRKMYRPVQGRG